MKTFGKIVASASALLLVGTLTLGAVSYASAQDSDDNNTPTQQAAPQQQRWGNGAGPASRFGDGPMGWFAERFGERMHNWMGQRMGHGQMGEMPGMMGRMGGMMGGAFGQGGEMITVVAKTLDMSETDLRAALVDGKSVADLASEKDVDLQLIINALMTDHKAKLDEAVAAGTLTQERADQMLTNMAQMIPEHLNQPFTPGMNNMRGMGSGMMGSGLHWGAGFERGFEMLTTVAKTLDMPEADLLTAVRDGKSIATISQEQGVDLQKVVDAILAERKTALDAAVAAGTMTQAQADLMLQNMTQNLPEHLNQAMGAGGGMGFRGMGQRGGMYHNNAQK